MQIIDREGRLFGKINLIDFIVIFFIFALLPVMFLGYRIIKKRNDSIIKEEVKNFSEIELNFMLSGLNPEVGRQIKTGNDIEAEADSELIGKIISVGAPIQHKDYFNLGGGEFILGKDCGLIDLPVKVRINLENKDSYLYYKDRQILINSLLILKVNKHIVTAMLQKEHREEEKPRITELELYVVFKGISEDVVRLISKDDMELNSEGRSIVKILDIGKVEDNTYDIDLSDGNSLTAIDVSKKQLNAKIRLTVETKYNNQVFFKNQRLLYNSYIEFKTDKYSIKGKISRILYKEQHVNLQVKFSGIIPELASLIKEGDVAKDMEGRIKGQVKSIVSNKSSEVQVLTLQDNKYVAVSNPSQKDIVVILDLICDERNGTLYFKDYLVKVGSMLNFATDSYSMNGTVIGLEEK